MRIRTIKPEFWQDEDLSEISETARLIAIGLLNCADDEGYLNANEKLLSSLLFPLTEPSVSIHECLSQLVESGYLRLYKCHKGKKVYGHVVNFLKHQKVNRPTPSKIKGLADFNDNSLNDHGVITVGKERNLEQGKEQGKGKGKGKEHVSDVGLTSSEAKASNSKNQEMTNEIFEYWREVMNKNVSSKLTKERLKVINDRIKEGYTVEQIKMAIYGCSVTPHNMGQNENNKRYDGIELICRTGSNVERFANNAADIEPLKFSSVTQQNINTLNDWHPGG